MIGCIPPYDTNQQPDEQHLYPQQLTATYNAYQQNSGESHHPGNVQHAQYFSPSPSIGELAPDTYAPQPQSDFSGGSFVSVGAAFGFHPDHPIQIQSQHLPQSQEPLLGEYMNMHLNQTLYQPQPPPQPRFTPMLSDAPQPMHNAYETPGWNPQRRESDVRQAKRVRRSQETEDSDDEQEGNEFLNRDHVRKTTRLPGACIHCKQLKVRCHFDEGQDTCNRCRGSKRECTVVGRKPRRPPPKREQLLNRIREQETELKSLREKLSVLTQSTSSGPDPDPALSPTSILSQPRSPRVPDKDIQAWIDRAHESVNVGDLNPSAVPIVDEHERLSAQEESDEDDADDAVSDSPEPLLRPPGGEGHIRSPAVGTALSPIGMIASSALRRTPRRESSSSIENGADVGVANESYFRPGMSTNPELRWSVRESQPAPRILSSSLVSPREVDKLFEIFFDRMNLSVSLLDPKIYTAQTTYWRSPFLFTVVCAIASRYLVDRPELYRILMGYAKMEAGQALVAGLKSPELVAGYILLSLYPVPSARWEEDRGWLMLGVAIRMATDLNLHHSSTAKFTNEQQAREVANRTRIWINCYNLDRSTSTQFGKPSTIKEDYIAGHSKFWYKNSGFNYDIHLNGYTQLLRVLARFHEVIYSDPDAPTGLNKAIDFEAVTMQYEQELLDHWAEWEPRFQAESDLTSQHCLYRIELLRLANAYSRLVILSFRFQHAFQNGLNRGDPFLQRCLDTASSVVKIVVDNMAPHPYLRTAPDAQFVFASFGSVFLLKLLRPRFASVLEPHQKDDIIALVGRLIDVLQSEKVAIDERHTPKLYARFLAGLLERHTSSRQSGASRSSEPPSESNPAQKSPLVVNVEKPVQIEQQLFSHPVFRAPIVTPPSPRPNVQPGLLAPLSAYHDGASTVSSTIRSHASSGTTIPDTIMTDDMRANDDGMLTTMRAIADPLFWDDMMMPGFSWTPLENPQESLQLQLFATN